MVVPQPLTGQEIRGHGRDQRIHVHFFDEPPTRGWVSSNRVREYQGWLFHFGLHPFWGHFLLSAQSKLEFLCMICTGSDSSDAKPGGVYFCGKPVIRNAMELADGVMFDSPEKRLKIPLCTDPSDAEEDDDEEMEVTR